MRVRVGRYLLHLALTRELGATSTRVLFTTSATRRAGTFVTGTTSVNVFLVFVFVFVCPFGILAAPCRFFSILPHHTHGAALVTASCSPDHKAPTPPDIQVLVDTSRTWHGSVPHDMRMCGRMFQAVPPSV